MLVGSLLRIGRRKNGNPDLTCLNCAEEDRQEHLLFCDEIVAQIPEVKSIQYETIFSNELVEISKTIKIIKKALKHRDMSNKVD